MRVFHYKVTVLLESIDLRSYLLFYSLNISLTALLESISIYIYIYFRWIKISITYYASIMPA